MFPWLLLSACAHRPVPVPPLAPQALQVADLDALKSSFNAARDRPRLIVLLSAG
jgi:hypothetical protein